MSASVVPRSLHLARFSSPSLGGTERYIWDLISFLESEGGMCLVASTNARGGSDAPWEYRLRAIGPSWAKVVLDRRVLRELISTVDLVHLHDLRLSPWAVLRTARKLGKPVVVSTHGLVFHTRRRRLIKALAWRLYLRPTLRRVELVLADSQSDLAECAARGLSRGVVLFENPVSVPRFGSIAPSTQLRSDRLVNVLYFGRIDTNKNLEWLIDLCWDAPDVCLSVVGEGEEAYVNRLVERAGSLLNHRICFCGSLSDPDLGRAIENADCLVFPSSYEGFGLTLVEGMATGKPVVASDILPYREIVGSAPVPLVPLGDLKQLEDSIRRSLLEWPSSLVVNRALEFSWSSRGTVLIDLYRGLSCLA